MPSYKLNKGKYGDMHFKNFTLKPKHFKQYFDPTSERYISGTLTDRLGNECRNPYQLIISVIRIIA